MVRFRGGHAHETQAAPVQGDVSELVVPRWLYVLIALQIAVPVSAFVLEDRPTRFGFQMFASRYEVTYQAFDKNGRRLELGDLVKSSRPELPWVEHLPEFLCDEVEEAATVTVQQPGRKRTLEC